MRRVLPVPRSTQAKGKPRVKTISYIAPAFASREAVAELAAELPTAYLMCREMQHSWMPHDGRYSEETKTIKRVIRCDRCGTFRHQELSLTGVIISSHYDYPDGFLAKGVGRIAGEGRAQLRIASVMRQYDIPAPVAKTAARRTRARKSKAKVSA